MTPNELVREEADFIEIQRRKELRDHFAGLAMQGMIACGEEYDNAELGRFAYDVADAMIQAREADQ